MQSRLSPRGSSPALSPRAVSTALLCLALFSVSWERLASIDVGGLNLKLSTALFTATLVLTVFDALKFNWRFSKPHKVVFLAFFILGVIALTIPFATDQASAAKQLLTIALGAVVPLVVIIWQGRMYHNLDILLTYFIRGGWLASIFGLYQLAAFYSGLPQLIDYRDMSGGLGRISAFNYEAAFFAYFLILVIGAIFARAALRGSPAHRGHVAFFIFVIILANSRSSFLTLPLLFILLFASWPKNIAKAKLLPGLAILSWLTIMVVILVPRFVSSLVTRATSIFDPTEASSNAPRLNLYAVSIDIIGDHILTGIGPGNLILFAPLYGLPNPVGATSNSVIANNVWLQALLDGGPLLLTAQIAFTLLALLQLYNKRLPVSRMLMSGWFATFLISSFVTSYFYNTALWVILALAIVAADHQGRRLTTDEETPMRAVTLEQNRLR